MSNMSKPTKVFIKIIAVLTLILIVGLALTTCTKQHNPNDEEEKVFRLIVVDGEGREDSFTVRTPEDTVGEALENIGMIKGRKESAGFMVTAVNGVTAEYEKDGHYWAFYIGDEYAMTGVMQTEIEDGATYQFKVE